MLVFFPDVAAHISRKKMRNNSETSILYTRATLKRLLFFFLLTPVKFLITIILNNQVSFLTEKHVST